MGSVDVRFQDPGSPTGYLLEEILAAAQGAKGGGGVFAWANGPGIRAVIQDDAFASFLATGAFNLVVGLDSITDGTAIEALIAADSQFPSLTVSAFLHDKSALFHPKLAWFETQAGVTLLVGSGNLTIGGLRGNWEAFLIVKLAGDEASSALASIAAWIAAAAEYIVPITDPRVLARAKLNKGAERTLKRSGGTVQPALARDQATAVLVAEIPRSGGIRGRWSQANFDLANYEGFFGAKEGTQRRVMLYHVDDSGAIGDLESRPSVEVKSMNYRFELAAAKGLDYPPDESGRPIGVFVKVATGSFLYSVVMPGSPHYAPVASCLDAHWSGSSKLMRRVRLSVNALGACWPASPILGAKLPDL